MAEEYRDLMDRLWLAGALAGLATAPVPDDIDLARSYADHDDLSVRRAARRLLSVTATTHDTGLIVRLADAEHDAALRVDLLTAALRTSGFDAALDAAESLDRPDSLVARALDLADRIDLDVDVERVEGLLASDSRDVRSAALRILVRTFDEPSLLALLDRCAAATPRYYDVVGRLDRLVHGPEFARNRVTRELAGA
jgi:hypothetical protein